MQARLSGRQGSLALFPALLLALCAMLSACVTINIVFPPAAIEKVADQFIDDIWELDAPAQKAPRQTDNTR
jgi:starvation-inducible outer membrane lipoprotein